MDHPAPEPDEPARRSSPVAGRAGAAPGHGH
jgi:hypothetical protein